MGKLQLTITCVVFGLLAFGTQLAVNTLVNAAPPPQQPILKDGRFRCPREADVWAHFAGRVAADYTPNDADAWLRAWRDRGGACP